MPILGLLGPLLLTNIPIPLYRKGYSFVYNIWCTSPVLSGSTRRVNAWVTVVNDLTILPYG